MVIAKKEVAALETAQVAMPSALKTVSEVVAILGDMGFAAGHVVKVNKGSPSNPRYLDIIEWHVALEMMDKAFGPFGYDLEIVGSTTDYANGIYTVDMKLTGRAVDDVTGEVVSLIRPGRGVGLVPRSAITSDAEHDRQSHGAKSDAITNATKSLGKGFGLYLYKKSSNGTSAAAGGAGGSYTAQRPATSAVATDGSYGPPAGGRRPSEKQMAMFIKNGYPQEFVDTLEFGDWKGTLDDLFGHTEPRVPAPTSANTNANANAGSNGRAAVTAGAPEPDDIPFS
jgi:hypothetical protein